MKRVFENRMVKFILGGLNFFYTAGLIYVFFLARRRWREFPERNYNIVPLRNKIHHLQAWPQHTARENAEVYIDIFGNILIFIPFPFLLLFLLGFKSYRRLLFLSFVFSAGVELIQFITKVGVADVDDILFNTIGAGIGILMLYVVMLLRGKEHGQMLLPACRQKNRSWA